MLKPRDCWNKLKPIYFITIFSHEDELLKKFNDYISVHQITNNKNNQIYFENLKIIIIELNKFKKTHE